MARIGLLIIVFLQMVSTLHAQIWQGGLMQEPQLRTQSTSPTFKDTLELPFMDDFSGIGIPNDSIRNFSYADNVVRIRTLSLHGLIDGDSILMHFAEMEPSFNNRVFFVDVQDRYTFDLYTDPSLSSPLVPTNILIPRFEFSRLNHFLSYYPDSLRWQDPHAGALINNTMAVNPPSYGVASFDGLTAFGGQYNETNVTANGYTDVLTSQAINLEGLVEDDSVYFSFYYQEKGFGDQPDSRDTLIVEFKSIGNNWARVWTRTGDGTVTDTFEVVMLKVALPEYAYKGFQFRFRTYGRQSGRYDIWNVDWVYLDSGRSVLEPYFKDFAPRNMTTSMLLDYTEMPAEHYFSDPAAFVQPTLSFEVTNFKPSGDSRQYQVIIQDNLKRYQQDNLYPADLSPRRVIRENCNTLSDLNILSEFTDESLPRYLRTLYRVDNTDDTIRDFGFNNRVTTTTYLDDVYAYDDGTAESALGFQGTAGAMAVRLIPAVTDTLTEVKIAWTRGKGPNLQGLSVFLKIWNAAFEEVYSQVITISYAATEINAFNTYTIWQPFVMQGGETYYIGYQKNFLDLLTVGYDRNNDQNDEIFFRVGATWANYVAPVVGSETRSGALMMRFRFDDQKVLTNTLPNEEQEVVICPNPYPNPLRESIKLDVLVSDLQLIDVLGRTYSLLKMDEYTWEVPSDLPSGLYIYRIADSGCAGRLLKE